MGFFTLGSLINAGADLVGGDGSCYENSQSWIEYYRCGLDFGFRCPGQPLDEEVRRAVLAAPQPDIEKLIQGLASGNAGRAPGSREELANMQTLSLWVAAAMGGNDCRNKTNPWLPDHLRSMVGRYGTDTGVVSSSSYNNQNSGGFTSGTTGEQLSWQDQLAGIFNGAVNGAVEAASEQNSPDSTPDPKPVNAGFPGFANLPRSVVLGGSALAAYLILKS